MIERFGTGKGCDICKPTVASILASTGSEHILDGEQASLQDSNDHFLANIQRNGTYWWCLASRAGTSNPNTSS